MSSITEILEAHGINPRKVKAWARAYSPFIMGGNCHHLIRAEIDCKEPVDAGKGFFVQVATHPEDPSIQVVVEPVSGGVVGSSLAQVEADIAACDDVAFMRKQIRDAAAEVAREGAKELDAEEFWARIKRGRRAA